MPCPACGPANAAPPLCRAAAHAGSLQISRVIANPQLAENTVHHHPAIIAFRSCGLVWRPRFWKWSLCFVWNVTAPWVAECICLYRFLPKYAFMKIPSFAVMLAAAQLCITAFLLRPFAWRPCGRTSPHTRAPGRNSRPGFAAIRPLLRAPARLDPWTSALSTLRPLLPTPLFPRLRLSRFHTVAASCGATGASVPADAGDCFPGPLRYGAASTGDTPRLAGA